MLLRLNSLEEHREAAGQSGIERVLYSVSRTIRDTTRPGEIIVRYGDGEFMVLLPDTDALTANKVGSRLCRAITKIESSPQIDVSYGVAELKEGETLSSMISGVEKDLHETIDS